MGSSAKSKKVLNNMLSQIVVQFVTLIAGILVPRFIILYYGSEINGLASSVTQIVNYIALLEAGLGTASIHALYKPLAQKDYLGASAVCVSAKKFFSKIGLFFTIAVLIIAVIYPFLAKGNTDKITIFLLMIAIAATNIFEYFFHAKYRVLLTADQKLYIIGYARAIGMLLQTIVKLILIFMRVHIIFVYLVSSMVLLLRILFVRAYIKKRYSWLDYSVKPDDGALSQRKALVWHQIAGLVVNNSSSIMISVTIPSGLSLASIYSVYNMVVSNIYNLVTGAFSNGVVATFGQARTVRDESQFKKSYRQYEFGYYIVTSVIYGTMAAMLIPFVALYTRSADINYVSYSIAILFMVVGVLNATRVPGGMLINAAGHFTQTKKNALTEAGIHLVFMLVLVWPFKIEGILFSSVISFLYRVPDIIIYTNKKILKDSPFLSIRRAIRMWFCCGLSAFVLTTFLMPNSINSWLKWIICSLVSFVVTLMITIIVNAVAERESFSSLTHTIAKRIKRF